MTALKPAARPAPADDLPFWRRKAMKDMTQAEWESLCDGCGISWLPPTCAYKLVAAGRDLYWWHPLISGDPETVHQAGVSVRGKVGANELNVKDDDLEDRIVSWPLKWPKGAKALAAKALGAKPLAPSANGRAKG